MPLLRRVIVGKNEPSRAVAQFVQVRNTGFVQHGQKAKLLIGVRLGYLTCVPPLIPPMPPATSRIGRLV